MWGEERGPTSVDVWMLDMQLLCCRLVRVTLYAECLLNGQYFEEKWEISIFRAKFLSDLFANQAFVLGKISGKCFSRR